MKVKELIELLREYDEEMEVLVPENYGPYAIDERYLIRISEKHVVTHLHKFVGEPASAMLIIGD